MGTGFAQTDPRYGPHTLGYGPALGTIHEYGCKLTTNADDATWAGWPTNPVQLNDAFIKHGGIFQRDPTGTFDYLPDDCLARLWPDRFKWLGSWQGLRSDLVDKYLPTPDVFLQAWIHANGVPTHYFPLISGRAGKYVTDDSWDNIDKSIWAYAGLGVFSTIAIQSLHPSPPPKPAPPVAPAKPPVPIAAPPANIQPSEPFAFYDFVVAEGDSPDLHPMGGAWTLSQAITAANEWVADKPAGYELEVVTEPAGPDNRVVYTASSPAGMDRPGVV